MNLTRIYSFLLYISCGIVLTIAILVWVGWSFDVTVFKSILPGWVAMNPTSALAFFLAAGILLARNKTKNKAKREFLVKGLSLIIFLVGFLKILNYYDVIAVLQVDKIFFTESLAGNQMAPNTAFCFILLGLATGLAKVRKLEAQLLVIVLFVLSLFALFGYAYGITLMYNFRLHFPMAFHTALCFFLLSISVLALYPHEGVMKTINDDTSGGTTARKLIPTAIVLPFLIGLLRLQGEKAGLYSTEFGVALNSLISILILIGLIYFSSRALSNTEMDRRIKDQKINELASIVEGTDDAVIGKTLDGIVTSWNSGAERLYGYSKEEIIGENVRVIIPEGFEDEFRQIIKKIADGKTIRHFETTRRKKNGEFILVSLTISPMRDSRGTVIGVSEIARDITEQRKFVNTINALNIELGLKNQKLKESAEEMAGQYEVIQSTNAELEEAYEALQFKNSEIEITSKYKSAFLANMSHELRTPLNSILILSKILEENKANNLTEKQVEFARIINKSGNDLLTLINDILDLSKIESGKISLEMATWNPSQVDSIFLFNEIAKSKKINYHVRISEDIPAAIHTDKFRVEQIIKNLLSNAFKFTPEKGSITFEVSVQQPLSSFGSFVLTRNDSYLAFSIQDTGIGISQENQKVIFEAFKQADSSTSKKYGGTGLGLTISRELARILGGEIVVESEEGRGSTFTLYLPLTKEEDFSSINSARPNHESVKTQPDELSDRMATYVPTEALKGKKVLVVDDDIRNIYSLHNVLEDLNMEIVVAENGLEAIKKLEAIKNIDIVLLDMMMPEMDGYEMLQEFKARKEFGKIPVIVLTAQAMVGDKEKCLEAGASDYISKPIDTELLIKKMEALIGREAIRV